MNNATTPFAIIAGTPTGLAAAVVARKADGANASHAQALPSMANELNLKSPDFKISNIIIIG